MTAAVEVPNQGWSIPPPVRLMRRADEREHQGSAFAVLLTGLARPFVTATERDRLDLLLANRSASATAAPGREALHEQRAAEFQETGVFGLMEVIAFAGGSEDSAAVTQQAGTSLKTSVPRALQQTHAPDMGICPAVNGTVSKSETSTQGVSPRQPSDAPPRAHTSSHPQDAVSDAAPVTIRVRGRAEIRSQERLSFNRPDQSAPSLASGQTSAVQVSIAAAEHGLSVFARVGRMEPTERARLRHAAALLLAEHGHVGATVTLDADLAEAKGE